jgi:hypothetical protein
MAKSRKDCLTEIAERSGKSREEVGDALDEILDRADGFESDGMGRDEAYDRARDEFLQEVADQYARERRGAILDMRKESSRHRYYEATRAAIRTLSPKKAATAFRLALEAKLVGVNLPFLGNRRSVDAQYVALRRQLLGGFSADLDRAGLLKVFASKHLEEQWTDELFELNREAYGKPGVTKNAQALEIAKTIRKWQKQSMAMLNREGAWVRSYSGYVTRTSRLHWMRCARCGARCVPGIISTTASRSRSRYSRTSPSAPVRPANCTSSQAATGAPITINTASPIRPPRSCSHCRPRRAGRR